MKLLVIENNPVEAAFIEAALSRESASPLELVLARSLQEARERLPGGDFDCVLLDLDLPDATELECVDLIRATDERLPVVALTDHDNEPFALTLLDRGVQDCLVKRECEGRTLLRGVRYAVERKRAEVRQSYLVKFDALTEIGNRQYFQEQLQGATARARREGRKLALFFLDLDNFRIVNETIGHHAGDQLLQEVARRLASQVRTGDVMARLGGDEFAIMMEGVGLPVDAGTIAQQLLEVIAEPFSIDGRRVQVTTSIGITLFPSDDTNVEQLLKNAEIAMYQAKNSGHNNFKFFAPHMHAELVEYHDMQRDMAEALRTGGFHLVFQPKVNLLTRRLEGLEALLRWDCPKRGSVGPGQFIPLAEASGLIVPLGYWVMNEACATVQRWRAHGLPVVPVSVNVSTRQFQQADFDKRVVAILEAHDVSPRLIEIEMTESLLMEDTQQAYLTLCRLKEHGFRIAIDDFGTGHSCLSHLRRFPIDVLKIAHSFVNDVASSEDDRIIIDAIISLAASLKLETVAEGVETNLQLDYLLERGCHVAQGFLFGMPMVADQVEPLLRELLEETYHLPAAAAPGAAVQA